MAGITLVPLTSISKGSVFNKAVTADEDIFSTDLSPSNTPTTFRIYACFGVAGVLTVRRTSGEDTVSEQLNLGGDLVASAAYIFDILVEGGESINLRYSSTCTCLSLKVLEVLGMVS